MCSAQGLNGFLCAGLSLRYEGLVVLEVKRIAVLWSINNGEVGRTASYPGVYLDICFWEVAMRGLLCFMVFRAQAREVNDFAFSRADTAAGFVRVGWWLEFLWESFEAGVCRPFFWRCGCPLGLGGCVLVVVAMCTGAVSLCWL